MHTKAQLLELLYRKALALSGSARSEMGVGPIVNLQSNDAGAAAAELWVPSVPAACCSVIFATHPLFRS